MIDKDCYGDCVFINKRKGFMDESIIHQVFEKEPHNLELLNSIDFSIQDNKQIISHLNSTANNNASNTNLIKDELFFCSISSQIYSILEKDVVIPTKTPNSALKKKFCVLEMIHSVDSSDPAHKQYMVFVAFLGLDFNRPFVLDGSIRDYIVAKFPFAQINILEEYEFGGKAIILPTVDSPLEILSTTKQLEYRVLSQSILNYRVSFSDSPNDSTQLDILQSYLIEQQVRFELFKSLAGIINDSTILFSRQKSLTDATGNLFFRISDQVDSFYFSRVFFALIDYGFIPSISNLDSRLHIDRKNNHQMNFISDLAQSFQTSTHNPIYPILVRLLTKDLSHHLSEIDNLVIKKEYEKLELFLTEAI